MKDINFFSIYYDKSSTAYRRKRMLEIGLFILLIIAVVYAGLTFWKLAMERETQQINEYLMSPAVQKIMAEYNLEQDKLSALQEYNQLADGLKGRIDQMNNLTTEDLSTIAKSIPSTSRMESIGYGDGLLVFIMDSPSLAVAAQIQVRLQESGLFETVVLTGIKSADDGRYTANYTAYMKGGQES